MGARKMKLRTTVLQSMVLLAGALNALPAQEFSKAGTTAAQFLKIPVGAKAIAMANTFTSVADDISTMYWNPAGLASLKRVGISVEHSAWIADMQHNVLGFVLPLGKESSIGFGVNQLSSGDIETTTIEKPTGTGTFYDAADMAISVSYARYLTDQVSVGVTAKYVNQRIWNTSANSLAFDLGILLHPGWYGMKMGLSFQNFGPEMTMGGSDLIRTVDQDPNSEINPAVEASLKTQPYSLPMNYRLSMSMPIMGKGAPIDDSHSSFLVAIDAVHPNDNPEHYSIGAEYGFQETLFVRGGYVYNTSEQGLTVGGGLVMSLGASSITLDYAYAAFGIFPAVHVFSLGLRL